MSSTEARTLRLSLYIETKECKAASHQLFGIGEESHLYQHSFLLN